ncbi:MAG: class I SAM-dependent methyltransferase [Candidatus Binatus sp.]|uniref:class I SAM-dependent methyltransferase n=1 Tax=Candidatus Binatus sp. TaxID=2811406 RepID=UPI003BB159B5
MSDFAYVGSELNLFAGATTWKCYVRFHLRPYLSGDILEVGAGIGASTATFNDGTQRRWVCLEPDRELADRIKPNLPAKLTNCEVVVGTLSDLGTGDQFDSILYMDVLEHIEADAAELARAASHLRPNGFLAVLSPAFPWLFTPFDAAIGHYRRYTKNSLRSIAPQGMREVKCIYLDSAGLLASLGNKLFLRSPIPSKAQIQFWDRTMVPISRYADRALNHAIGKSILGVWQKVH